MPWRGIHAEQVPAIHAYRLQKNLIVFSLILERGESASPLGHDLPHIRLVFFRKIVPVINAGDELLYDPLLGADQEFSLLPDQVDIALAIEHRGRSQNIRKNLGIPAGPRVPTTVSPSKTGTP